MEIICLYIGGEDYTPSLFNVLLEANTRKVCTNLSLDQDSLVEGTESYYLNLTNNDTGIIINRDVAVQIRIVIQDSTGSYKK